MRKKLWSYKVPVIAILVLLCNVAASAQTSTVTPDNGTAAATAFSTERCGWRLNKPTQMWGWLEIEFTGSRSYGQTREENSAFITAASITIDGTYLPSETLTCQILSAGAQFGTVVYPYGTSYQINHDNPDCVNHSNLDRAGDATHPYFVSEEMYNANFMMAQGADNANSYWTDVGLSVNYPTLSTQPGGADSGVYPHPRPDPDTWGEWDPISGQVWLNNTHQGISFNFNQAQWSNITAHEFGHAIGFGHSIGGDSQTIMQAIGAVGESLTPRTLEKCAATKAFPVPIRIG